MGRQARPAVQRHDPRAVDHLVEDHHAPGRLEYLHAVVVRAGQHRRAGIEAHQAALGQRSILRAGRQRARERVAVAARPRHSRDPGNPPVGRVDHQRGPPVGGQVGAEVHPELVVAVLDVGVEAETPLRVRAVVPVGVGRRLDEHGRLLRRQHRLARQFGRALHGCQRAEVPHALQVRVAPGGARQVTAPRLGRRRRGAERRDEDNEHAACHGAGRHRTPLCRVAHRQLLLSDPVRGSLARLLEDPQHFRENFGENQTALK